VQKNSLRSCSHFAIAPGEGKADNQRSLGNGGSLDAIRSGLSFSVENVVSDSGFVLKLYPPIWINIVPAEVRSAVGFIDQLVQRRQNGQREKMIGDPRLCCAKSLDALKLIGFQDNLTDRATPPPRRGNAVLDYRGNRALPGDPLPFRFRPNDVGQQI
jgi:hypothetical protein